jgi:hypothetical protein
MPERPKTGRTFQRLGNEKTACGFAIPQAAKVYAGDDLLSRWTHYHRPQVLIGRVRDGNGSFHLGMVTGNSGSGDRRHGVFD